MTIKILSIKTSKDYDGPDITRHANIIISDNVTHYTLGVGDLPLTGDLQPILDAREAELWTVAQTKGKNLAIQEVRRRCYHSVEAGGWTDSEFQEAIMEYLLGNSIMIDALETLRAKIKTDWP